ncbi:hypothetical protein G4B88_003636 [Cannabis sativa]|uniref:Cytochrome P450 n=1 Tax=Cannabis sativa TaxID=3483 RepID=A0A7J6DKZ1_CANSA|nr:hypothetical protein G4B88_003636 [Cannabis sativa]
MKQRSEKIVERIIQEHKDQKKKKNNESATHEDFVDVLLKFQDRMTLEIFAAGSETSSSAVDWAMAEMIRNRRVMKKAQEEVRQVFNKKGKVDEAGISDLKYLKSVVKETLRLHPSAPLLLPRESINAWAIGRDPKYWTEPESFMPERFVDSNIDFKGNNFEYIPFGAGRRICPGISYGVLNIELPLAFLLYHFDWKLPYGLKHEDLDMTELFGVSVRRKDHLSVIPIAYDDLKINSQEG